MTPLSRFFGVFTSPGAVFEDIRRDPRGWWVPLLIGGILVATFGVLYVSRYDMSLVLREQLKDNAGMKLMAGLAGQAEADKTIERAVAEVAGTPPWVLKGAQVGNIALGMVLIAWFFTFLYGLIALMMGWLGGARTSRLWLSLAIILGALAFTVVGNGALQFARAAAARGAGGEGGGEAAGLPPAPPWMGATQIAVALLAAVIMAWGLRLLAKEPVFGRILGAVSYALAPAALAGVVGIAIVLLREPDATPFESLIPDNLTSLLGLGGGALASLGSSLGLFALWSLALRAIGLGKVLGRSAGSAAVVVLVPWGVWVLCKALFSAVAGG